MKIDILSDIHCDHWVKQNQNINKFKRFIELQIKPKSDYIIIAGDLAHSMDNGIKFIKALKEYYKRIIMVFGNHDYYMTEKEFKKYPSYKEKIADYKSKLDIDILDGDLIEIEGIKIFGCGMWYDFSYLNTYWANTFPNEHFKGKLWSDTMNDSNWIKELKGNTHTESYNNVMNLFYNEISKFDKYSNADIIVTHVSPVNIPSLMIERYRNDPVSSFFCYNGIDQVKNCIAKYWIFGHTHVELEYELFNTKMICNPLGYPHEKHNKIKTIEI